MWGSNNEMIVFPILELIKKEVKSMIRKGEITLDQMYESASGSDVNLLVYTDNSSKKVVVNSNLLSRLESNDFELELEKKDLDFPNMLTGVVIKFGEELHQLISLIRQGGKLIAVKISVVLREPKNEKITNPLGMGGDDFSEYVRNKRLYGYFDGIYNDDSSSQSDKDNAEAKKVYLATRNQELRNVYSIPIESDMSLEELMSYMSNPLGMNAFDFILYCTNARCWSFPDSTAEEKTSANQSNIELRAKYGIDEDEAGAFSYDLLKEYLPNPLGMQALDFVSFVDNLREIDTLDITDPAQEHRKIYLEEQNSILLRRAYTTNSYSLAQLEVYLEANDTSYEEKTLLRILISLSYNSEGKLKGVKSETLGGDE